MTKSERARVDTLKHKRQSKTITSREKIKLKSLLYERTPNAMRPH